MHALMRESIDGRSYLGAVTLVARAGRTVDLRAWGYRDLDRTAAAQPDDIYRIYSMTKPIATAAVLMLMEEGRLALDDPVARHLPAFAGRRVTVRHLLTHTSGLGAANDAMERSVDLAAYAAAAVRVPTAAPAGERFEYNSVNAELAARIVEVASGMTFEAFLRARIFAPLGMRDTGFAVPERNRARIAAMTTTDPEGRLTAHQAIDETRPGAGLRRYASGAGGLYSTAADFARFCNMLAAGGELDGVRILSRATVDLMFANQLTHLSPPVSQYDEGFGFGGFVNLDDPKRERPGSVGAYGWSGAAGTYFMIDRVYGLVAILLTQHEPGGHARDPGKLSARFYNRVYQSLPPASPAPR